MKLITRINEDISIFANESQYVVKVKSKPNQRFDKQEAWYFPTLDMCFQEIFDYLFKKRSVNGRNKSLKEVAEIILKTREEILEIMKPFVSLRP